jgi:hypothetical protein
MPEYVVVDVSDWEVRRFEPMGSKPDKVWLQAPPGAPCEVGAWLFKPATVERERDRHYLKGDDWAEKIASELAGLLGCRQRWSNSPTGAACRARSRVISLAAEPSC